MNKIINIYNEIFVYVAIHYVIFTGDGCFSPLEGITPTQAFINGLLNINAILKKDLFIEIRWLTSLPNLVVLVLYVKIYEANMYTKVNVTIKVPFYA